MQKFRSPAGFSLLELMVLGQFPRNIYCVDVLASDGGGRVGLQAQYAVLDASGGGSYR